jgi:hypothetical protein
MEDISKEQSYQFAKSDVYNHVIDEEEVLEYYNKTDDEVVIETPRNKCLFRKDGDLYKLLYREHGGSVWRMTPDIQDDTRETVNTGSH